MCLPGIKAQQLISPGLTDRTTGLEHCDRITNESDEWSREWNTDTVFADPYFVVVKCVMNHLLTGYHNFFL